MKIRKFIAGAAVAVLAALGVGLTAQSASAHTGDLSVTAVCNTETGNYDVTAKLTTANTGLPGTTAWRVGSENFEGTPQNANGMQGAIQTNGAQTVTLTTFTLPGDTTGKGPWVYAYTTWDGFAVGSDGQLLENLGGDCDVPIVVPPKPEPYQGQDVVRTDPVCVVPNNGSATITVTTTGWTQDWLYNEPTNEWVIQEKVYAAPVVTTETVKLDDCAGPQPEDKVTFTEWVDGEFECDATEVPQTRTKTVTPSVLVEGTWIDGTPVVTTETGSRPLTDEEQEAADIECAGPQPENKVTFTEWKTGEYVCDDTTVQITRTETSTEFVRGGAEWVEGESVSTTQTETRDLTAAEIEKLDCETGTVVTPPTDGQLAATGGDIQTLGGLTAGALMVGLIGLTIVLAMRHRQLKNAARENTEV